MRAFATTLGLGALLLASPAVLAQATAQNISTGTIQTKVFNNGILHGDCNTGATPWMTFNSIEGGCGGGFLIGLSASSIVGDAYLLTAAAGWSPGTQTTSTTFPYATLTNGVQNTFTNVANNLAVVSNHYWGAANPDFVVHHYVITNNGGAPIVGIRPGMFWDYDVNGATAATNTAGYDAATQSLWVQHPSAPAAFVFGMQALTGTVAGFRYDMPYPTAGSPHLPGDIWTGLTVMGSATSAARDQRGVIGIGPYTIPAGGSLTVAFAEVAGTNLADFLVNAAAAKAATTTAAEGGANASALRLDTAVPNPSRGSSTITFALEEAGSARLTVYDVLGRQVAVLAEGALAAGSHTATVNTAALPNGTYVVRLEANGTHVVRSLAVSH
ncbi:MAG TPA: T9SS type A sorting domain-containing protein [Rhodothermales bacterium]|nr:T9SS type A sorting domain-containing protein [Rhodothermales bacterium]